MKTNYLTRMVVIKELLDGKIGLRQAAQACGLSVRQTQRLRKKAREEGVESIRHGNSGRKPSHAVPEELEKDIASLYRHEYRDYSIFRFSTVIAERCGLSHSTIYRILNDAGCNSTRKGRRSGRSEIKD